MKNLLLLALCAMLFAMFLFAGCGGGSTDPIGAYAIGVYGADSSNTNQEIDASLTGTAYTAYPGMLHFELVPALPADFVLYHSTEPQNDNVVADMATFKEIEKLAAAASCSYNFSVPGRYLVKAFDANTSKEITWIRLTIASPPVPN